MISSDAEFAPVQKGQRRAGLYASLFLDILGWGKQLLAMDQLALANADPKRASAIVEPIIVRHEIVRIAVEAQLKTGEVRPGFPASPDPNITELQSLLAETRYIYSSFSDCFVVTVSIAKHAKFGSTPLMHNLLSLMTLGSLVFTTLLSQEIPVRGAIEMGMGAEYRQWRTGAEAFVGASQVKAYELERSAEHPHIRVGPQLYDFISEISKLPVPVADEIRKRVATLVTGYFASEPNGVGVDYLHPNIAGGIDQDLLQKARQFVRKSLSEAHRTGNATLIGRYSLVNAYFDRKLSTAEPGVSGA